MFDNKAIRIPQKQEILVVRGSLDNRTFEWAFDVNDAEWVASSDRPWTMILTGRIIGAHFANGLDARLAKQRESIDGLLRHVRFHCPEMQDPMNVCEWRSKNA